MLQQARRIWCSTRKSRLLAALACLLCVVFFVTLQLLNSILQDQNQASHRAHHEPPTPLVALGKQFLQAVSLSVELTFHSVVALSLSHLRCVGRSTTRIANRSYGAK
jgi:hypothetical protein